MELEQCFTYIHLFVVYLFNNGCLSLLKPWSIPQVSRVYKVGTIMFILYFLIVLFCHYFPFLFQLKTAISRATSRNDVSTVRDGLEVSAEMYKKDASNVADYVQRHLISLSIWEELRYSSQVI